MHPLVILGAGYTGKSLYHLARSQNRYPLVTSRAPQEHLLFAKPSCRIEFDLTRSQTWDNIPLPSDLIWCFPALPQDRVVQFFQEKGQGFRRILLLGSTAAYSHHPASMLVDERASLDLTIPRAASEEFVRVTWKAVILRLAGLYGPGRHVLNWIRRGKIHNSDRWVNFIHVEDAAGICLAALDQAGPGESYIVSDGIPRKWSDICLMANTRWKVPLPPPTPIKIPGKRLSPHKLVSTISYTLQFPDLFEALDQIERREHSA